MQSIVSNFYTSSQAIATESMGNISHRVIFLGRWNKQGVVFDHSVDIEIKTKMEISDFRILLVASPLARQDPAQLGLEEEESLMTRH